MSLFSYIKQKFFYRKQQSPSVDLTLLPLVPNPFIPWEVYPDIDPAVCYLLKEMNRHGSVSFGFHIGRVFQREKKKI